MNHYNYKCFDCGKKYSPEEIEKKFIYLCPDCHKQEEKMPLRGVLLIEYNYKEIAASYNSGFFSKLSAGEFWQYPDLWPLRQSDNKNNVYDFVSNSKFNHLAANAKPVQELGDNLSIFNDTLNPTLSYKDRASILVCLKALELGVKDIATASTGNAASSLAGICAKLGLNSHIFVPKRIPNSKLIQIQSFGANVYIVDGSYDDAFDLCNEVCKSQNWYNRNTAYNPLTIEGKKSAAYDIYIATKGKIQDAIFVPVGDGVIISGLFKGFDELLKLGLIEKLPKLIAVQAEGSNSVVRYINGHEFEAVETNTIADSIDAEAPRNLYMAAEAVKKSEGYGIAVSDDEIIESQKQLAAEFGVLCEPSAAASYAGYKISVISKLVDENAASLLMITGNGLKDLDSLEKWNETPEIKSVDDWKEFLSESNPEE